MKKLLFILTLVLGIGLMTTSCSKQKDYNELEHVSIDLYKKQGSVALEVLYTNGLVEEHILHPHQRFDLLRSEVNVVYITALEDNTQVRVHGYITKLNKSETLVWYADAKTNELYNKWLKCIQKSDGSDVSCEECDILYNKEGKFQY